MDASTQLVLAVLGFLLVLLIVLLLSRTHFLSLVRGGGAGWNKLEDESESTGILSRRYSFGRMPKYSTTKESYCALGVNSPILEKFPGIGNGKMEAEKTSEQLKYLVPTEEISCTLQVVEEKEEQADVHATPVKEQAIEASALDPESSTLRRALSTDSIDSTSSSILGDRNDIPTIHIIVSYDEPSQMLSLQVQNMTDAVKDMGNVWMLFFLLPHPKPLWRTEAKETPSSLIEYNHIFQQCVRKGDLNKIALMVQLYASHGNNATIVGQCKLRIRDLEIRKMDVPISLSLAPIKPKYPIDEATAISLGEILFLVTFTNERLNIIISKVRNIDEKYKDAFIRVYVVIPLGKVVKKKTSIRNLIDGGCDFSESLFIPVPKIRISKGSLRFSIVCGDESGTARSIGHVTLGPKTSGKELGHWTRALNGTQGSQASWHHIRQRNTEI